MFMALILDLNNMFLEVLNTFWIYPNTSKVRFVKRLANSKLTYVPNMIHICPNIFPLNGIWDPGVASASTNLFSLFWAYSTLKV